jgi:hypothetical protein
MSQQRIVLNCITLGCIFLGTVECHPQQLYWGSSAEGFELAVGMAKDSLEQGSPVEAIVVLRNTGDSVRYFLSNWRWEEGDFGFTIVRDREEQVERRSFGPSLGGFVPKELPPHSAITNKVRLDSLYDLTKPGTYVVTASRGVPPVSEATNRSAFGISRVESGNVLFRITSTNTSPASATSSTLRQGVVGNSVELDSSRSKTNAEVLKTSAAEIAPQTRKVVSQNPFLNRRKLGAGVAALLVVMLLAILWRASRRKPNA